MANGLVAVRVRVHCIWAEVSMWSARQHRHGLRWRQGSDLTQTVANEDTEFIIWLGFFRLWVCNRRILCRPTVADPVTSHSFGILSTELTARTLSRNASETGEYTIWVSLKFSSRDSYGVKWLQSTRCISLLLYILCLYLMSWIICNDVFGVLSPEWQCA